MIPIFIPVCAQDVKKISLRSFPDTSFRLSETERILEGSMFEQVCQSQLQPSGEQMRRTFPFLPPHSICLCHPLLSLSLIFISVANLARLSTNITKSTSVPSVASAPMSSLSVA